MSIGILNLMFFNVTSYLYKNIFFHINIILHILLFNYGLINPKLKVVFLKIYFLYAFHFFAWTFHLNYMNKIFFHKNCMCLQINFGLGPECILCLALEGLKTGGLASWESFVSGQRGINTILPGTVYQSCVAQPNQLHCGVVYL